MWHELGDSARGVDDVREFAAIRRAAVGEAAQTCELHHSHWMQDKCAIQAGVALACAASIRSLIPASAV